MDDVLRHIRHVVTLPAAVARTYCHGCVCVRVWVRCVCALVCAVLVGVLIWCGVLRGKFVRGDVTSKISSDTSVCKRQFIRHFKQPLSARPR